jgi:predicted nucleic acid-binding protein
LTLVDSSVWIDYFNGAGTPATDRLDELLSQEILAIGDLILAEVLQGFADDRQFSVGLRILSSLPVVEIGAREIAIQAARNFRTLRKAGITVRKTIDILIATWCFESRYELLHDDRDFDSFEKHLGLRVAEPMKRTMLQSLSLPPCP